ncbi:hypothetical protein AOLI_G00062800 [Acnodon oligacanthus]
MDAHRERAGGSQPLESSLTPPLALVPQSSLALTSSKAQNNELDLTFCPLLQHRKLASNLPADLGYYPTQPPCIAEQIHPPSPACSSTFFHSLHREQNKKLA